MTDPRKMCCDDLIALGLHNADPLTVELARNLEKYRIFAEDLQKESKQLRIGLDRLQAMCGENCNE